MRLHQTAGPASGAVGAVELKDASQSVILAVCHQHRAVLGHAGLAQGGADLQHSPDDVRELRISQRFGDGVLGDAGHLHALLCEPALQLGQAVRVFQSGELLGFLLELLPAPGVILDDLLDHGDVERHAVVVHVLVQSPELLL